MEFSKSPTFQFQSKSRRKIGIDHPGLWKDGRNSGSIDFNLPADMARKTARGEEIAKWAEETRDGNIPEGWEPPSEADLTGILNRDTLVLRHNTILREIEVRKEGQFSLQLPLTSMECELPPGRKEWLDAFLRGAAASWPLVRFGVSTDGISIVAEVNLTGAPHAVLETLLQPALDSFRWIVAGLVSTVEFIASPESESGVLDTLRPVGTIARAV